MPEPHRPGKPGLTVITTCMGRLQHLRQSLPRIAALEDLRCIVVDYGCPDRCGDWVEANFPGVEVVRAGAVDEFHIGKARNMGARHADTPWICFVDADTLVETEFGQSLKLTLQARTFARVSRGIPELAGVLACASEDFRRVGGYDEVFTGWGCEDDDLVSRLRQCGCTQADIPGAAISSIQHGDDERTRYHAVRDRFVSLRINSMYFQIKTDLARLREIRELPLAERQAIHARIRALVMSNPRAPACLDVMLPASSHFTPPPGWSLNRTVRFHYQPCEPTPDA